jgi:hypothetical protein
MDRRRACLPNPGRSTASPSNIPRPDPRLECHPGLPRWVHRNLPPLRFAAREGRSASGRVPPMDYLGNPERRSGARPSDDASANSYGFGVASTVVDPGAPACGPLHARIAPRGVRCFGDCTTQPGVARRGLPHDRSARTAAGAGGIGAEAAPCPCAGHQRSRHPGGRPCFPGHAPQGRGMRVAVGDFYTGITAPSITR